MTPLIGAGLAEFAGLAGQATATPPPPGAGAPPTWVLAAIAIAATATGGAIAYVAAKDEELEIDVEEERTEFEPWNRDAPGAEAGMLGPEEVTLNYVASKEGKAFRRDLIHKVGLTESQADEAIATLREMGELDRVRMGQDVVLTIPDDGGARSDAGDGDSRSDEDG